LQLDAATQKHLDIFENEDRQQSHSLLSVLDRTASTMGSRLLKRWLTRPLKHPKTIHDRQEAIAEIITLQQDILIHPVLRQSADVERINARIALKSARPRDLAALRHTLQLLPELSTLIQHNQSALFHPMQLALAPIKGLQDLLELAIVENPPVLIRD